jgi:hypothetical protein
MAQQPVTFVDFARLVLDALESTELEYLIGGSVAVWAWGEVRTTQDIDLVINLPGPKIMRLSQELEKRGMLVPPEVILDLLLMPEGDLPINAMHLDSANKAELFLLRDHDQYRRLCLSRRRLVDLGPPLGEVYVHAPEDLIINKVYYFSLSEQTKHVRDIASIIAFCGDELDMAYIAQWTEKLSVAAVWNEIQTQAARLLGHASPEEKTAG